MAAQMRFTGDNPLADFAKFLGERPAALNVALDGAGFLVAEKLYENAGSIFGDVHKLHPLAEATQAERLKKGYTPNDPLYRDGTRLKASMEKVHTRGFGAIGSSDPVQRAHELGYINARTGRSVPPRPVYRLALQESKDDVLTIGEALAGVALGAARNIRIAYLTARTRHFNSRGATR